MKQPKRQTVTGVTTERLRRLILSGELGAGETLRQDELSAQLGVSRTPLREAIITLQAEGLVTNHPHKGAVVYKPTADELKNIYEVRLLLETYAAREAVLHMTPDRLAKIEDVIAKLNDETNLWELIQLNHEFRETFYEATQNKHLVDMIRSLTLRADPYVGLLVGGPWRPFSKDEFRDLLDAMHTGNGEKAATLTRNHLEATVQRVLPMLRR